MMPWNDSELRSALEALKDSKPGRSRIVWQPGQDALLLEFWGRKRQSDIAKTLGCGVHAARERYEYLKELKNGK